jgi:hypothetical protein
VTDVATVFQVIVGEDPNDVVTQAARGRTIPNYTAALSRDALKGKRIGVPKEYRLDGLSPEIQKLWDDGIAWLKAAGAEIVLVALHTGAEYQILPTDQQKEVAAALVASPDVDLVYGHHSHVVQPMDKIGGKWIAYGLGNMVAKQHRLPELVKAQHELMARFTFTKGSDGRWTVSTAEARPAIMSHLNEPLRYLDLATLLADPQVSEARKAAYRPFYDRAVKAVTALGADTKGLVIAGR